MLTHYKFYCVVNFSYFKTAKRIKRRKLLFFKIFNSRDDSSFYHYFKIYLRTFKFLCFEIKTKKIYLFFNLRLRFY